MRHPTPTPGILCQSSLLDFILPVVQKQQIYISLDRSRQVFVPCAVKRNQPSLHSQSSLLVEKSAFFHLQLKNFEVSHYTFMWPQRTSFCIIWKQLFFNSSKYFFHPNPEQIVETHFKPLRILSKSIKIREVRALWLTHLLRTVHLSP